jgi:hypothetical protein
MRYTIVYECCDGFTNDVDVEADNEQDARREAEAGIEDGATIRAIVACPLPAVPCSERLPEAQDFTAMTDKPLADTSLGLTSYRYSGRYGWIMIGARDNADALREAARSTINITIDNLQVWDNEARRYVSVAGAEPGMERDRQ